MWFKKNKLKKLILKKADGELSVSEEQLLTRLITGNPAFREMYNDQIETDQYLSGVKDEEETIDVSEYVMIKINSGKESSVNPVSGQITWDTMLSTFPSRFAMVAVFGIIMGSVITMMIVSDSPENSQFLSGTMVGKPGQGISYSAPSLTIKMVPYRIDNLYYLNFMVDSRNPIEVETRFDDMNYMVKKSDFITTDANQSFRIETGEVTFGAFGITSFLIVLEKTSNSVDPLTITTFQNQSVIIRNQIILE
jgi:hypothetical protein